jgi:4-hydroxy-L-threonine phosphate dehydrogenase PdxA
MSHSHLPLPRFALTIGDPAGIGPEITLKALASEKLPKDCEIVVFGDMNVLEHRVNLMTDWPDLHSMTSIDDYKTGCINVLDMKQISVADFETGKPQASCGKAAYAYFVKAIDLCMEQKLCGVITSPISKDALHLAGIPFIGHTEILVAKTGVVDFSMLFALDNVYVVHVTTHVSVRNAVDLITCDTVLSHIKLLKQTLDSLGKENPRIAVAGLNPHAGETGCSAPKKSTTSFLPFVKRRRST